MSHILDLSNVVLDAKRKALCSPLAVLSFVHPCDRLSQGRNSSNFYSEICYIQSKKSSFVSCTSDDRWNIVGWVQGVFAAEISKQNLSAWKAAIVGVVNRTVIRHCQKQVAVM